jgi:hypothetical protein
MVVNLTNFLNHEIFKRARRGLVKRRGLLQYSKVNQWESSTGKGGEKKEVNQSKNILKIGGAL